MPAIAGTSDSLLTPAGHWHNAVPPASTLPTLELMPGLAHHLLGVLLQCRQLHARHIRHNVHISSSTCSTHPAQAILCWSSAAVWYPVANLVTTDQFINGL
jgi:hypothetical protein